MRRSHLKTIRFSFQEARRLEVFLRDNPAFGSFSSLGRAAVLAFIRGEQEPLKAVASSPKKRAPEPSVRPSFLWDYDLTEAQVRKTLRYGPTHARRWLVARILDRLTLSEVLSYLSLKEIRQMLPTLRMDPKVKKYWEEAIRIWTHPTSTF